ncbi:MAG: glycosyltransferase family 1 protein [Bdellovibrionales bacterium]|nr:glycosyltransferase family 1 protein [Bdellovibrionales bacterium]
MKLLLLNHDWFAEDFRAAGHEVITCGFRSHLDVELTIPLLHIKNVIQSLPVKFDPDCIIIHDDSAPIVITGLEELEVPKVFYSVDAHHHTLRHRLMSRAMDHVFVAQKDYGSFFTEVGVETEWLPLWASREYEPSDDIHHQVVFVGNMNPKLNPERVLFFEGLAKHVPIDFMQGEFWTIFPHAHIIMNQTVKGDLNFRVFEAMISGSLLLTERSDNGLLELFTPGEHLELYTKNDIEEAAETIRRLLSDTKRCREIGMRGREEILLKHRSCHRAEQMLRVIESLEYKPKDHSVYPYVVNAEWLTRRLLTIRSEFVPIAARSGAHLIRKALNNREPLDSETGMYVAYSLLEYYRQTGDGEVEVLFEELAQRFPDILIFKICQVWNFLNQGREPLAKQLTLELCDGDEERIPEAYGSFNSIVMSVLENSDEPVN